MGRVGLGSGLIILESKANTATIFSLRAPSPGLEFVFQPFHDIDHNYDNDTEWVQVLQAFSGADHAFSQVGLA